MPTHSRIIMGLLAGLSGIIVGVVGFHLGGNAVLRVGQYSSLLGAGVGSFLTLFAANTASLAEVGPFWLRRERLGWTLIGCGCLAWGLGEGYWRYLKWLGQNPLPSLADIGYSSFAPLAFLGLFLLAYKIERSRVLLLLDSLIAMGSVFAIVWYLWLGSLAQLSTVSVLEKFLGLYYPTTDVALVSYVAFLLLRRYLHVPVLRGSLSLLCGGFSLVMLSDFLTALSVAQHGVYLEGTWTDLGWPLGMLSIGAAAYLRNIQPGQEDGWQSPRQEEQTRPLIRVRLIQTTPYVLLAIHFAALLLNGLSNEKHQQYIRPVLLIASLFVICLVIIRQLMTMADNARLRQEQQVMQAVNQLKDDFLVHLNHELRTPLTAVIGCIELLVLYGQELDAAASKSFLGAAAQHCDELLMMVNHLLEAVQMSQQVGTLHPQCCAVRQIIDEAQATLDPREWQKHSLQIICSQHNIVWADPQSVKHVLLNLLSNACKYTPPHMPIVVQVFPRQSTLGCQMCICVQDAGPGIPLAEQPFLFQKFVRLQRDMGGEIRGSGLGLYLCKQHIEALGGRIWVESTGKPGEGSRFCFTLPLPPFGSSSDHAEISENLAH